MPRVDSEAILRTIKPFDPEQHIPAYHFNQFPDELVNQFLKPLDDPPHVPAAEASSFLRPRDYVLGVVVNDKPRAYPLLIGNYYHQINDVLDGVPILVND